MADLKVSVVIPIFAESQQSVVSLANWISTQRSNFVEWIVVETDGEPWGSSRQILDNLVTVTRVPRGRGKQMNAGAALAKGDVLIFLHSDTRLEPAWNAELLEIALRGDSRYWGSFSPRIDGSGFIYRWAESWGSLRSRKLKIPFGDQAIFISASLFREIGGFDEEADFMEELDLGRRLNRLNIAPTILPSHAVTSNRRWKAHGLIFYSARNFLLFALFLIGVPRKLLRSWY